MSEERKIREYDGVVVKVRRETHDSTTLVIDCGEPAELEAGQFMTIDPHQFPIFKGLIEYFETEKNTRERPRAFSIASAPDASLVEILAKIEPYVAGVTDYPPLLCPYLVYGIREGTPILFSGFSGSFLLRRSHGDNRVVHLCAGSGIAPNIGIIRDSLRKSEPYEHILVYSNKTWKDVIYRAELDALADDSAGKLRVHYRLTREPPPDLATNASAGRVDADLLRSLLPNPAGARYLICGPGVTGYQRRAAREAGREPEGRFIEAMQHTLSLLGVPNTQVMTEVFG